MPLPGRSGLPQPLAPGHRVAGGRLLPICCLGWATDSLGTGRPPPAAAHPPPPPRTQLLKFNGHTGPLGMRGRRPGGLRWGASRGLEPGWTSSPEGSLELFSEAWEADEKPINLSRAITQGKVGFVGGGGWGSWCMIMKTSPLPQSWLNNFSRWGRRTS